MSAANVEFLNLDGTLCPEGSSPARFTFRCVGHNRGRDRRFAAVRCGRLLIANAFPHGIKRDPQGANGGRPQWDWDGKRDAPTFTPSVNCGAHCGWHGYIRAGRCVDTSGNDEGE